MNLSKFVKTIKRRAHIGSVTVTDDQITEDIINSLNERMFQFWRAWAWDWSVEPINSGNGVVVAANSSEFTVDANIGQILKMYIDGQSYFLKPISMDYYLGWKKTQSDEAGTPTHYIRMGRDSSNNLKFKLWRTPNTSVTVMGWGKKRITKYAVSDIATNSEIAFFPEEVQDILVTGVLADIEKINNKLSEYALYASKFKDDIEFLIGEEQKAKPDEKPTTRMPRWMVLARRQRGVGTAVR